MILTYLRFSDIRSSFALSSLAPGRCFWTWVLITYQFKKPPLSLRSFAPTNFFLPLIFRKLVGMTLPLLRLSLFFCRGILVFFCFLCYCCCSLHFSDTEFGQIFLAASKANLKPGGPLKWKKRLVKDVRLSLSLTEAMKIARLTSSFLDVLRLSSPRPAGQFWPANNYDDWRGYERVAMRPEYSRHVRR